MKQQFNLDRQFIIWFYEQPYPDVGSNRSTVMNSPQPIPTGVDWRDYWMRQAFKKGAEAMANETRCVLGDWAAAASGLDPELICPDEVFDRAEANLTYFYAEQFGEDYK